MSNDTAAAGQRETDSIAVLLAPPPTALLALALRWAPSNPAQAARAAALAFAMRLGHLDLTTRHPHKEPAAELAGMFLKWLGENTDNTGETELRIWCLNLAFQMTIPDRTPTGIVEDARRIRRWLTETTLKLPWLGVE